MRDKLRGEKNLIIVFGSELRGGDLAMLVEFGSSLSGAKYICLGDYANSRGAADKGLYPDLLPGYLALASAERFAKHWNEQIPPAPRMDIRHMVNAVSSGEFKAEYVAGTNPLAREEATSPDTDKPF